MSYVVANKTTDIAIRITNIVVSMLSGSRGICSLGVITAVAISALGTISSASRRPGDHPLTQIVIQRIHIAIGIGSTTLADMGRITLFGTSRLGHHRIIVTVAD